MTYLHAIVYHGWPQKSRHLVWRFSLYSSLKLRFPLSVPHPHTPRGHLARKALRRFTSHTHCSVKITGSCCSSAKNKIRCSRHGIRTTKSGLETIYSQSCNVNLSLQHPQILEENSVRSDVDLHSSCRFWVESTSAADSVRKAREILMIGQISLADTFFFQLKVT